MSVVVADGDTIEAGNACTQHTELFVELAVFLEPALASKGSNDSAAALIGAFVNNDGAHVLCLHVPADLSAAFVVDDLSLLLVDGRHRSFGRLCCADSHPLTLQILNLLPEGPDFLIEERRADFVDATILGFGRRGHDRCSSGETQNKCDRQKDKFLERVDHGHCASLAHSRLSCDELTFPVV